MKALEVEYDPERPVIEAIQQSDPHAMDEFIHRQKRFVRGVIFSVLGRLDEIDDVAQRVWIQVWQKARRLEDPNRWRSWLYRIAHNAAIDAGRRKQRHHRFLNELVINAWPQKRANSRPDQTIVADEQHQAVLEAIGSLPEIYREPFVLKHLEGWSYRQIAEALDMPTDTVETRLVRARRLLRQQLAGKV